MDLTLFPYQPAVKLYKNEKEFRRWGQSRSENLKSISLRVEYVVSVSFCFSLRHMHTKSEICYKTVDFWAGGRQGERAT